jgi:hypothetical protein
MEIIKVTPNMIFLLELEQSLPENQKSAILQEWETIFPDNKLIITQRNSLKILEKS